MSTPRPWLWKNTYGPTLREDGDTLVHVVSYDHHRFCDGRPTQGEREIVTSHVTCIQCAATAELTLIARAMNQWP